MIGPVAPAALQEKEALLFLLRFAKLQHENRILGSMRSRFEACLLDLLHTVCTAPGHYVSRSAPLFRLQPLEPSIRDQKSLRVTRPGAEPAVPEGGV